MAAIQSIPSGVPGLDAVLGGGLPALSFNVVSGDPGAGKTTLAHQIIFANATPERPALFCTVVGEPPLKMLRYQRAFAFFDVDKVGSAVHFQNLTDEVLDADLDAAMDAILAEVERIEPAFVVVDSFRSVAHAARAADGGGQRPLLDFVQRLSIEMTRWEATTFLLGEFDARETLTHPLFTIADGILWLQNVLEGDTRVRKIQAVKMRGQCELAGMHIFRINDDGVRVYPRDLPPLPTPDAEVLEGRQSSGITGLDDMMSGGFIRGDATIVSGPAGSGKSVLGMQFIAAGLQAGEAVVVAIFEEGPRKYMARARELGFDFKQAQEDGRLSITHRRSLDLSVDEMFEELRDRVADMDASRLVIDSLSGLQVATTGAQAERLRRSVGRMVSRVTEAGVSILMTAELNQSTEVLCFAPHDTSFLADNVILQRYVEFEGRLETVLAVVKMRRSRHLRSFHRYSISEDGIVVGEALHDFHGLLSGVPQLRPEHGAGRESESRSTAQFDDGEGG